MNKLIGYIIVSLLLVSCTEDDASTTITGFSLDPSSISEGNELKTQVVVINVIGDIRSDISIPYYLKEGTAKFGVDVVEASGMLDLTANQTSINLPIEIVGDSFLELTESFSIVLNYEGKDYNLGLAVNDDDTIEEILVDQDGFYTSKNYPSMQLAFSDEFTGTQLNENFWTYELGGGGWGNNELQHYTNSNSRVENDQLFITAKDGPGNYTSTRIITKGKVKIKYGRIDVRAKLPKGQGIWPAIWMLGENISTVGWPACGEIDIMELLGHEPNRVYGTAHYTNGTYQYSSGSTSLSSGDFSDQFHVFSILWDKTAITWYVDNKPFRTFNSTFAAFEYEFFFIMNVAIGGNWPGSPNASTVFPQEMIVDYIRVFQ